MDLPPHPTRTWSVAGIAFDARIVQLVVFSTLLLLGEFYVRGHLFPLEYNRFLFHFLVPAAIIVILWREDLRVYGLRIGAWRFGLAVVAIAIPVMAVVIWVVGSTPAFTSYYQELLKDRPVWRIVVDSGFELFAWEFFCRGWLLGAFGRKYGTDAVWLQAIPFALMHLFKPPLEALSTVFGGALFGLLAWRTGSFLYGFLIHWFMVAFILVIAGGGG